MTRQGSSLAPCSRGSGPLTRGSRAPEWRPRVCCLWPRCPLLSRGSVEAPFSRKRRRAPFMLLFKHSSSMTGNQVKNNKSPADRPAYSAREIMTCSEQHSQRDQAIRLRRWNSRHSGAWGVTQTQAPLIIPKEPHRLLSQARDRQSSQRWLPGAVSSWRQTSPPDSSPETG